MINFYTKQLLKARSLKVSDETWQVSQAILKKYRMTRESYMQLGNKLICEYFQKEGAENA